MSVCIAAKTHKQQIVMVSDHMVSIHGGAFSGDSALLKIRALGAGWSAMFAGDDITAANPIVRDAGAMLNPGEQNRTDVYRWEEVAEKMASTVET